MNPSDKHEPDFGTTFSFHVSPPANRTTAETTAVIQYLTDEYKNFLKTQEKIDREINELISRQRAAIVKYVGESNWNKFLEYSRKHCRPNYRGVSTDPDGLAKMVAAKRHARRNSLTLLNEADLRREDIKRIHQETAAEIARLHAKEAGAARLDAVPEDQVPMSIRTGKGNPWQVFSPPYDSWVAMSSWNRRGGSDPTFVTAHDAVAGRVGHRSNWEDYDAGNDDFLFFGSLNDVGVWHYSDQPLGTVEAWIKARCFRARSWAWLDDEFGWSDSSTEMDATLNIRYLPPGLETEWSVYYATATLWSYELTGSPDSETFFHEWVSPDTVRWFHLTGDVPVRSGWNFFRAGITDFVTSKLNDVSAEVIMRDVWFIETIMVDVHPFT